MVARRIYLVGSRFRCVAATLLCLAFASASAPAAGDDENFFTHLHTDKVMANVTVSPDRAGPVNILIQLETVDELPLSAKAVSVTLTDTQSGKKLKTVQAERVGEDHWQITATALTAGRWMLALDISISEADKVSVAAPILIGSGIARAENAEKHHH